MQVWGSVSATRLGIAMRKGMAARGRGRRGGGDVQVGCRGGGVDCLDRLGAEAVRMCGAWQHWER